MTSEPQKKVDLSQTRSLSELRKPGDAPLLHAAIKAGQYDEVAQILKRSGERLAPADYMLRMGGEPSVIELLTGQGRLAEIFTLGNWSGDVTGMHKVASLVPLEELNGQMGGDGLSYDRLFALISTFSAKGNGERGR